MEDISIFFQPVNLDFSNQSNDSIGENISFHNEGGFPEIQNNGIAVIEVPEYRNDFRGLIANKSNFRSYFYNLMIGGNWSHPIYDLGVIQPGETIQDTYHAIAQVTAFLVRKNVIPIIIGGSQDLTIAMYKAYDKLEQFVNLTTIDSQFDFGEDDKVSSKAWLNHILLDKNCYLFNYSNLGAQTHFLSQKELALFEKLYFDVTRLGDLNANPRLGEPVLRNSDFVSFDLSVLRNSDINGLFYDNPNGLFAHQACQLARYAGISDKLTSFGLFNYYPAEENRLTCNIVAQCIWYFIDGYQNRKFDFPIGSKKAYKKFRVSLDDFKEEIVFLKSDKSSRWWMEVPYPDARGKYERHHLVPCSYSDYEFAMKGEVPNLWWKTYQKLV